MKDDTIEERAVMTGSLRQRSYFAQALAACCTQAGYTQQVLAKHMIQDQFPSHLFSQKPKESQENVDWLANRIQELQGATLADDVPFDSSMAEFIRYASQSLAHAVPDARKVLLNGMLRDEWERFIQM
jgi:hypothetical protein